MGVRRSAQGRDFLGGVQSAQLGWLGDRNDAWLCVVLRTEPIRSAGNVAHGQFAVDARTREQFQTGTFGGRRFIDVDVRPLGAHDTITRTRK